MVVTGNSSGTDWGGSDLVITTAEGLADTIGIVGALAVSMLLVRVSLGEDSNGADDTGSVTVRVGSLDHSTILTSNLLVDWLADLPGGWGAFFHLCGHGDLDRDGPALSDGLGNAVGLGDGSGDGVAGGDRLGVAEGVSNLPGGGLAGSPWHSNTLGNRHTLGNSNTVRNSDAFWHSNTFGHCNAMRNSHAFGNSNTFGDGNGASSLDRDLSALPVNLLLALGSNSNRGGNSYRGNRSSSKSNRCWTSSKTTYWESIEPKELSISIGISISFSFSIGLTLAKCMGKELWSSRKNTGRKSSSRESSSRESSSRESSSRKSSSVNSKSRRKKTRGSRKSIDNSRSCHSMTNNIGMGLDLDLGLSAHLMNNVIAFLNKGGFRNGLCLGGALLLCGALLGICALLLCGARLLSGALLSVLALLLCGALGHVSALLLSDSGTFLVRHLPHNVSALCLSVCGALLLRNLTGSGGALLD